MWKNILILAVLIIAMASCFLQRPEPLEIETYSSLIIYDRSDETLPNIVDLIDQVAASPNVGLRYANPVDGLAASFVRTALRFGRLDPDYVDAYHGPKSWERLREGGVDGGDGGYGGTLNSYSGVFALRDMMNAITNLGAELDAIVPEDETEALRVAQLKKLVRAMRARWQTIIRNPELSTDPTAIANYLAFDKVKYLPITFDTEVTYIYDEEVPVYDLTDYDGVLSQIDALLPGDGPLYERVDAFRNTLAIPEDKLQAVFDRAIAECRARTAAHFDLPEGETFRMEFVSDKSWSGYNYYQGGYESLIQINTDFPIIIDRAVDLGCHEGYPGHHVWNLFIERELVGKRGWIEYSVNPLFGPFGPIAEGSANYGIELAFPGGEKIAFERDVLFPMAGLDPAKAQMLDDLNALTGKLSHATNEIARQYMDGDITAEEAVPLIQKYYLASTEKSAQRLRFIDKYRAYVINYNIGRDRSAAWVEAAGDEEDARWAAFEQMLTLPMTPSDIAQRLD